MISRKEKTSSESVGQINKLVEGTKVIGDIFADQNFRIDGEVKGNVSTSSRVVIGVNGKITGNLTCSEADIEGTVDGTVTVDGLMILRKTALINGELYTAKIQIDEGAVFNGQCKMGKTLGSPQSKEVVSNPVIDEVPMAN
ncbi:MAG: polymer-forming cytoskeletal protein [Crocinitomicaceae bacterium]|nr:polymer-forming cytoskeletal protein [Crocinitomicaceae bacterium]